MLQAHNYVRHKHGCPEVKIATDLVDSAQRWAEEIANRGIPLYSESPGYGQNIAFVQVPKSTTPTGSQVTHLWYSERYKFDYHHPRYLKETSQFSRVIWKSTDEIGVGICQITDSDKNIYAIVVNYRPRGNTNMPGDFEVNVPAPITGQSPDELILSRAHTEVLI
ncbi:Golgi-associated plant pathogenesis-related protein 1-like [Tubulanus polymorphus]|uniref:Golgi-associated plant pathogenesis-related protein 1-like n=1 Tax=Tubulanus polymorphus TaxID=672921 RepID=UPI003DA23580